MANTEQQQELGAQALLELTKQKNEKSNAINNVSANNNEEINFDQHKDVEAEVMRLVGSALSPDDKSNSNHGNSGKKLNSSNGANNNKKRPFNDDDISQLEFQQWTTGFLGEEEDDEDVEAEVNEFHYQQQQQQQQQQLQQQQQQLQQQQQQLQQQQQQTQQQQQQHVQGQHHQQQQQQQQIQHQQSTGSQGIQSISPQKQIKRQRKSKNDENELKNNINVDPELAQLDTNPFVDDDMIDARTLESLGHIDHEYLRQAAESHRTDGDVVDVERLAVQAVAAVQAQAQAQQNHGLHHIQDQNQEDAQAQVVAAAAEAAAAAVAAEAVAADSKNQVSKNYPSNDISSTAVSDRINEIEHQHHHNVELDDDSNDRLGAQRKHDGRTNKILADPSETASLIAEAAAKASSWISANMHSKSFSKEEADAIDSFIAEYCHINKMTRDDICRRIWANERRKDDFWECIQKVLPLRTRASVYKHVRRTYHVFDVRGKWSKEDDIKLAELASEKEGQWKLIGLEMNRMPEDCRDRWRNYVKCGTNRQQNKWSQQEEDLLKQVVYEMVKSTKEAPKDENSAAEVVGNGVDENNNAEVTDTNTVANTSDNNNNDNNANENNGTNGTEGIPNEDGFEITKDNVITFATTNEPLINWTIVSEKLGGMRSRIQCRYKWNKLLRREAVERSKTMSNEDKLWLVSRIKDFQFEDSQSIDWNSIVALQPNSYYTVLDLKVAFEKLKSAQRDHRRLPFHQTLDIIINQLTNSGFNSGNDVNVHVSVSRFDTDSQQHDQSSNSQQQHLNHHQQQQQHQQHQQQAQQQIAIQQQQVQDSSSLSGKYKGNSNDEENEKMIHELGVIIKNEPKKD